MSDFRSSGLAADSVWVTAATVALAAVHKRITQVLKKASVQTLPAIAADQLIEPAEHHLFAHLQHTTQALHPLASDYSAMLSVLAQLHVPVDTFFAEVMVMTEDPVLRHNRLALLHQAAQMFLQVADLSVLSALVRAT